jgi:nitroreductase
MTTRSHMNFNTSGLLRPLLGAAGAAGAASLCDDIVFRAMVCLGIWYVGLGCCVSGTARNERQCILLIAKQFRFSYMVHVATLSREPPSSDRRRS